MKLQFRRPHWVTAVLAALAGFMLPLQLGAAAAEPALPAPAAVSAAPAAHELTSEDVTAWLDGVIPLALQRGDIAGATVAVVKNGQVLALKGYGYADVKRHIPVDPVQTLFRPGSTSKLFVWTAVMQLVEQGKLDLDRDINTYLDFKIPSQGYGPITLRNLMTHTGGFEERLRDFFVKDPARLKPYGEALSSAVPRRIYAPGQLVAYSNYGAGLAGYIVQRVSGEPFAVYVKNHIFTPLGMSSTSMSQPLEPALMARMSKGYLDAANGDPHWYEYTQWPAAGAAATTASDMARFMIAHLQDGAYGSARILSPATAELMHRRAYTPGPGTPMNGWALGFWEDDRNGHRILAHDGGTITFETQMRLVTDAGVGWFVSMNGRGSNGDANAIQAVLLRGFLDRYFPAPAPNEPTLATAAAHGREVSGVYSNSRRTESYFLKLASLFDESDVSVDPDGVLKVSSITNPDGSTIGWREVRPYQWRQVGGKALLVAVRDGQGRVRHLTDDWDQTSVFTPTPFAVDKSWIIPLLIGGLATTGASFLLWPVVVLARRRYGRREAGADRRASILVHLTALGQLVFIGAWFGLFANVVNLVDKLNVQIEPWLRLLQLEGLAAAIGAVFVAVHAVRLWLRPERSLWIKLATSVLALACLGLVYFAVAFRLLWPTLG